MTLDELKTQLLQELNLDDTEENQSTLNALVEDSLSFVKDSIDSTANTEDMLQDGMLVRAVKTLATQMFYDRTLATGTSIGLRMMLSHLKGKVGSNGWLR